MEEINRYLKDDEHVWLEKGEHVLWTATKLKREKLKGFWILTNLKWIQNTRLSFVNIDNIPFEELATLFPMKYGTFYLNLKEVKFIFKQDDRKTTYIGYILNEFIEEWDDEYLLCFGVSSEKTTAMNLFAELEKLFSIGTVIEYKQWGNNNYELYPVILK